jgi:magnesium chelatase family protein
MYYCPIVLQSLISTRSMRPIRAKIYRNGIPMIATVDLSKVFRVKTVALQGISPIGVDVEAHISNGLPAFHLVGLPSKSVQESRDRVMAVLDTIGIPGPAQRVTINLSPADIHKEGNHYDLPIALALLAAMRVIDPMDEYLVVGELALDGKFLPVRGILPTAIYAESQNLHLICPSMCGSEAAWGVSASKVIAPENILALLNHLRGVRVLPEPQKNRSKFINIAPHSVKDIEGQAEVKRALQIACAGSHHMLMMGAPGVGKSMLAKAAADLLPPLSPQEAMETAMIYSTSGSIDGISQKPPFRAPHHTSSIAGLIGGSSRALPGEISLAHNGILFLDELPEFDKRVIESLRCVLETGEVSIVRAQYRTTYPARFLLLAAMNPCRCGHLGNPKRECSKAPYCGEKYTEKLSGPILDRFAIVVHVRHPRIGGGPQICPETFRAQIATARAAQTRRFDGEKFATNGQIPGGLVGKFVKLVPAAQKIIDRAVSEWGLSFRGRDRVMQVARTIADLRDPDGSVEHTDVLEALSYRQELVIKNHAHTGYAAV